MADYNPKILIQSLNGGELSPEHLGRPSDGRVVSGLALCRNMIVKPAGGATRRPGFADVAQCDGATLNQGMRLITFRKADDDAFGVEVGVNNGQGYVRFLQDGALVEFDSSTVPDYLPQKNIRVYTTVSGSSFIANFVIVDATSVDGGIDTALDQINSAGHPFQTGDPIGVVSSNAVYPGPSINSSTTFYAIRIGANDFALAATLADALAGTPRVNLTTTTGGATLTWSRADHLRDDDTVRFVGSLPSPMSTSRTYYVRKIGSIGHEVYLTRGGLADDVVKLASANAYPGTLFTNGLNRRYRHGELVVNSGTYYTCKAEFSSTSFSATNWLAQTGAFYSITSPFQASDLLSINYAQSNDIMRLTHRSRGRYELRRWDSNAWWEIASIQFGANLRAPEQLTSSVDYGVVTRVVAVSSGHTPSLDGATAAGVQVGSAANQTPESYGIALGDRIRLKITGATLNINGAGAVALDHEFYVGLVSTSARKIDLYWPATGQMVKLTGGASDVLMAVGSATFPGTLRKTELGIVLEHSYKIVAVDERGQEGTPSAAIVVSDVDLLNEGASITLSWQAVDGAVSYRVYKETLGVHGLLASVEATETTFVDDGKQIPDAAVTIAEQDTSFNGTDYPGAVCYYDQRCVFAASRLFPQRVWATATGTESDLRFHPVSVQDTDRLQFDVASREAEVIRHLVGVDHLIAMTSETEYRITPAGGGAITPGSIVVRGTTRVGSSFVRPVLASKSMLMVADRTNRIYEIRVDLEAATVDPVEHSLRADHLFDGYTIRDSALQKHPFQVAWFTSSSGKLLGITYQPEHEVAGWHWHDTALGSIETVCVVPEGGEDRVYIGVNLGTTRRILRMGTMQFSEIADAQFTDGGVFDASGTSISVGTHLNGRTVQILADGVVATPAVVASGLVTLSAAATKAHIGLGYSSTLQTVPAYRQASAYGSGTRKNITNAWLRVYRSGQFQIGPALDNLETSRAPDAGAMLSELVSVPAAGSWNEEGQLFIHQDQPLPLTVNSITLELA